MVVSNHLNKSFIQDIKCILENARNTVYQTINAAMTEAYRQIGKRIVEEDQGGETRAQYGKGFSVDNLENMRKFYNAYPKLETASREFKLSCSQYCIEKV